MAEYSISQLGKFEECALQYKFLYVDKIKRYLVVFDVVMRSLRTPEAFSSALSEATR